MVPIEEMLQRLAAAIGARTDPDLVIIARTDARRGEGLDEAVKRARAYSAAGADVIFVEALQTREELEQLPKLIDAPLLANMVEGGKTPLVSASELEAMGYRVALFANVALRVGFKAVWDAMRVLHQSGGTEGLLERILTWQERQDLVQLPQMEALEARFLKPVNR